MKNLIGILVILFFSKNSFSAITLTGSVEGPSCMEKITKLWISEHESGTLLFQADVPLKSNFQVRLLPGKYKVVLNNELGCLSEESIELKNDNTKIDKKFILKKK